MKKHEIGALLGGRIKELREMRGFSQALLASKCFKAIETISNFERGKTIPSIVTLTELGKALGVGIHSFFEFSKPTDRKTKNTALIENRLRLLSPEEQEILLLMADSLSKRRSRS